MKRSNSIQLECPHCKNSNRPRVETLYCLRGSSTIVRTRICPSCNKKYYTSERIINGRQEERESLLKSFRVIEANITILKNKVMKLNG